MQQTIEILDPRAVGAAMAEARPTVVPTLAGKVVGFIDNTKPNFNHLIDHLADVLMRGYGMRAVLKRGKRVQSIPAPAEVVEELARECDLVITGSGD